MLQIFNSYPEENVQAILQPWQLFLLILAGWVNRSQQDAIDYLLTENRVLRQKLASIPTEGMRPNAAERA